MGTWNPRANRNTLWAGVLIDELHRGGIRDACISPGSRSTPLTLALAAHQGIATHVLLDERGAAFFALGLAKASDRPVALVCTSGTAAANFHPAILEAGLSAVPLLVLTADRPPLLRETGASQTIDQIKLYGDAVRWFHEVGEPVMREPDLRRLRRVAAQALSAATRPPAGAVHLNLPFRKPLEAQPVPGDFPADLDLDAVLAPPERPGPYAALRDAPAAAAPQVLERLAGQVGRSPRGLILCGPMAFGARTTENGPDPRSEWPAALAALARRTGYPVLAEPPAGVMCGPHDTSHVIPHADAVLQAPAFAGNLAPQLLFRFGSMPTGKGVQTLVEDHPDCPMVLVNEQGAWLESTHHRVELVRAEPARFCTELAERLPEGPGDAAWLAGFVRAGAIAAETLRRLYETPPPEGLGEAWFEGRVFSELAALLPEGALQYTASSMPVRDLAAFHPVTDRAVRHLVNRGANGIDGMISSALGAAAAMKRRGGPAVLVTGDLAFHHDANALLAARQQRLPLTVILINNNGGGIFGMLPIAGYGEVYESHFGTPHGIRFAGLCEAYGVPHYLPSGWTEFRRQVRASLQEDGPCVIEVRTGRRANVEQHRRVREAVAERLAAAFPAGSPPAPASP